MLFPASKTAPPMQIVPQIFFLPPPVTLLLLWRRACHKPRVYTQLRNFAQPGNRIFAFASLNPILLPGNAIAKCIFKICHPSLSFLKSFVVTSAKQDANVMWQRAQVGARVVQFAWSLFTLCLQIARCGSKRRNCSKADDAVLY